MMRNLTILIAATTLLLLSGCTTWPLKGQGGMAEHDIAEVQRQQNQAMLGPEHGLHFELDLARRHLDVLVLEGAELCFPATVVQAKQRETRITRALRGGLELDSANDLLVQQKLLARLERQLDYVKQEDICQLASVEQQKKPGDMGKRIFDLLNSDNQFALDSAELNPKYVVRLAEAVQLLRDQPAYLLRVTGHADSTGSKSHNHKLSLERAEKVGRYLQILGLPANRIQIDAVAANNPLFQGQAPHIRLVNRRVSIELVEVSASSKYIRSK